MAAKRTSNSGKSPMANIIVVAVALVVFIGAVALAVSMLGDEKPEASSTEPMLSSEMPPVPEISEPVASESEPESPESSTPASSSAGSSPASSSSSSSASSALPVVFNPNSLGSSGAGGIAGAKAKNSDVKGWIKVPGTNISHPVLYHSDVNYYLARDINKQQSRNGVIWADPDATFGSASELPKNTVMYGHNWTNISANPRIGSSSDVMFGQLTAYHHLNFAKVTPYIYYSTEAEEMVWKVFAAFYTDIGFNYIDANPSDATFSNVISGAKARSRHNYDVDVKTSDKIITLSTCTRAYGSSDRQRFVVMARLLRSGEEITAVNITSNPNPVLPKL